VAGSVAIQREGAAKLEPIKTAGLQANPDEGRRLGLMVSAGTGIPETMLWGDATLGNYATAKSLDRPTELQMTSRQQDWIDTFTDVINYAVDQNALSTRGQLKGKLVRDKYSGSESVEISKAGATLNRTLAVRFPAILEHDKAQEVEAVVSASTLGGMALGGLIDRTTVARLLLVALGVDNVDEVLKEMPAEPDEPNPPPPVASVPAPAVPAPGADAPGQPSSTPPPDAEPQAGAEARN